MLNNLKEKEWVYLITSKFIGRKSIQKITRNKMYTTIKAEICGKLERMAFIVETENQQQATDELKDFKRMKNRLRQQFNIVVQAHISLKLKLERF